MDPVTALSRRQLIALAVVLPLGMVASTIATVVAERVQASCPDERYGCARIEADESVIIGLLDASDPSAAWPVEDVARGFGAMEIGGHRLELDVERTGCSPEDASEYARELASDPPDSPPAALMVAAVCDETAVPLAQILSDSGITLVALNPSGPVPTDPPYHLVAVEFALQADAEGVQAIGLAAHLRDLLTAQIDAVVRGTIEEITDVSIQDEGRLLIPRTPLRDALIAEGFMPA